MEKHLHAELPRHDKGSRIGILHDAFDATDGFNLTIAHGKGVYDLEDVTLQQAIEKYQAVSDAISDVPALAEDRASILNLIREMRKHEQISHYHPKAFNLVLVERECEHAEERNEEDRKYVNALFLEAQKTYKARWEAIEKTAKILNGYGFKDGINVESDYNLGIEKEYPVSWVVNEAIYLATGYGEIGDLNGGLQSGDWLTDKKPNIAGGLKWILTNPRLQPVRLTKTQTSIVKRSFTAAYREHTNFTKPMSALWNFIWDRVGNFHEGPEELSDELFEHLWELRHEGPEGYYGEYSVRGFLDLLTNINKAKSQESNTIAIAEALVAASN